jgi:ssDNA-binding Zn-finger/Zn-ribbon topoisomerase 1
VYELKKNKKQNPLAVLGTKSGRCPYCGSPVKLCSADGIYRDNSAETMLYVCSRYPACDAYVRVIPGTKTPMGRLANGPLRALRHEAHLYFDRLHLSGLMSRKEAYVWLAAMLQAPLSQTHIGYLSDYCCRQVIEESKRLLENRMQTKELTLDDKQEWSHRLRRALGDGVYAATE